MYEDWIWRDEESGLGLRQEESEDGPDLAVCQGDEVLAILSPQIVRTLTEALRSWARPGAGIGPETTFQVYYVHEYTDDDGLLLACEDLGECDQDDTFTYNEPDVASVRMRVAWIGEQLIELHRRVAGEPAEADLPEQARAWVSIFRMPEDVRVWKGYFDELPDVPDEELLE